MHKPGRQSATSPCQSKEHVPAATRWQNLATPRRVVSAEDRFSLADIRSTRWTSKTSFGRSVNVGAHAMSAYG